ncbi:hypothetical protein Poli38472_006973 [Pythium oligandrum]|uniref:Uncharacterized protein n=1 Tax=Pythium oligandrum TaxID=41045 RepID=A0A8K1FHJ1_PYTOL|nr:hypothetical protein Poli38472_006973 [Pythium oligandrum]|eukprot:TMW58828.1 hypothetical protein Poli38472_006973 [Pythium oligandrum]
MTNSERARYYRERNAATRAETEAAVEELQRAVDSLEIQEEMYRQLVHLDVPPTTRANIVRLLVDFITDRLDTLLLTLQNSSHELERVEVTGDALAPIVRIDCSLRGHLTPSTTHQIYPHVIGNSVLLDRMMHDQVDLTCSCWFYFTPDGTLEHHTVEVNAVNGLRVLLGDLHTVGRVLSNVRIDRVTVYPNGEEIGRHASALSLAALDLE